MNPFQVVDFTPPAPPLRSEPAYMPSSTLCPPTSSSQEYISQDTSSAGGHTVESESYGLGQNYWQAQSLKRKATTVHRELKVINVREMPSQRNSFEGQREQTQSGMSQDFCESVMLPHDYLQRPPPPPPPKVCYNDSYKREEYNSLADGRTASVQRAYPSFSPPWATANIALSGLQGVWMIPPISLQLHAEKKYGDNLISLSPPPIFPGSTGKKQTLTGPSTSLSSSTSLTPTTCASNPSTTLAPTTCALNPSTSPTHTTCASSQSMTLHPTTSAVGPSMTLAPRTYKDSKVNPKEPGLPRALTDLFDALHCKLCEVVSGSTVQAKIHYSGKPHEKKIRQWLQNWSLETGLPAPKRPKLDSKVDANPQDLHCQLCGVEFSSVRHAEQHKMGKPHQKALRQGYCRVKLKTKNVDAQGDPSGRFGIGEAFNTAGGGGKTFSAAESNTASLNMIVKGLPEPVVKAAAKFLCHLCKISTTSQEHLDAHFAGAKHRKALANFAKSDESTSQKPAVVPAPVEPSESILASVMDTNGPSTSKTRGVSNDLSIYRTPSGQFYCHPCNSSISSEKTFREHTESKRHKYKVASLKRH